MTPSRRQLFFTRHLIDVGAMPNRAPDLTPIVLDASSPGGYRDAVPADYAPDGEKLWEWDPSKVVLHLTDRQKAGRLVTGFDLDRSVADLSPLGPNVGEFLWEHPEEIARIPGIEVARAIFFMSQKYRYSSGDLYVRYLYWGGGRWYWADRWLDGGWDGGDPAAVLRE